MSKYDGTKPECTSRTNGNEGDGICVVDGKPCTDMTVCRHRSDSVSEMTNAELAAAVKTETDTEKSNDVIFESAIRLMDMMNPNTKMLNVEGDEMSPLEMFSDLEKCRAALDGIKEQISRLEDLGLTGDGNTVDTAVDALKSEMEASELRHESDKLSMKNAIFVTDADFMRISDALQESESVDEWIGKIRSITGDDTVDSSKHVVKCQPTERTIKELFELKSCQ